MTATHEPVYERLWHELTGRLHHQDDREPAACHPNQGGNTSMDITAVGADLRDHIEQGKAWLDKVLETHVPQILTFGQQLASSEVGKALLELGEAVLPPEVDAAAASLIRFAVKAAAAIPAAAAETPATPEQPAPAENEQSAEAAPAQ